MKKTAAAAAILALLLALCAAPALAQAVRALSAGQLVYVPAYSHTYHGAANRPFYLTITLSVHNVDTKRSLTITEVDYYTTDGKLLTSFLKAPVHLGPLATHEVVIREKGEDGGSGGNFMVRWHAGELMNPP
ncbi:MAG: DUF3124 domain-containing protein, partial [Desulfovibrionaceae bacterium]